MEIIVEAEPKEIAALVVGLQERRGWETHSFNFPFVVSCCVRQLQSALDKYRQQQPQRN